MGKGTGAGTGQGEGGGQGRGKDAVDGLVAGGAAACCFLIFMWVIGIPLLLTGIGMVLADESGTLFTVGVTLIVIASVMMVVGVILIILFCIVGAKKGGNRIGTTTVTHNSTQAVVYTRGTPVGYAVAPPAYSQNRHQPPAGISQRGGHPPVQLINPYQPPLNGHQAKPQQPPAYRIQSPPPAYDNGNQSHSAHGGTVNSGTSYPAAPNQHQLY